jgi:hypothetical protein
MGAGSVPDTASERVSDPGSDPVSDPGSDPVSDPGSDPVSDPGSDPVSDTCHKSLLRGQQVFQDEADARLASSPFRYRSK